MSEISERAEDEQHEVDPGSATGLEPSPSGSAPPIQELIITLVGEYFTDSEPIWSGGLVLLLEELGFSPPASRIALGRVVSRHLLTRSKEGRRVFYRDTPRLRHLIADGHRQTFWFRYPIAPWDGAWTFVWYTIPEEHLLARRRLSRRLSFMGFGALQDGTWFTPHDRAGDVRRAVEALEVTPYVVVLVGRAPEWVDAARMVARGWDVEELQRRYAAFLEEFGDLSRGETAARLSPRDAFLIRTRALEAFRQIASFDPKIAEDELLPPGPRWETIECFNDVDAALRPAATEFVRTTCSPDSDPENSLDSHAEK
jgi:phenylacetic acid degradation operon negative regulatory protein